MSGTLYIVSTPIGNLEDISFRAVRILSEADIIACEDSRHTSKLLTHYSIKTKLTSYHEYNEKSKSQKLIEELENGKNIALVTDAGTPSISDPGYRIVKLANEEGVRVVPIPGPSSVISAVASSGLPTDKFIFLGFIPKTKNMIEKLCKEYSRETATIVFFESPKRIRKSLNYLYEFLGDREGAICRELTKIHEEIVTGRISELIKSIEDKNIIKGEITIVIKGYQEDKENNSGAESDLITKRLKSLKKLGLTLKDSVKVVSEDYKMPKKKVYDTALRIWDN